MAFDSFLSDASNLDSVLSVALSIALFVTLLDQTMGTSPPMLVRAPLR